MVNGFILEFDVQIIVKIDSFTKNTFLIPGNFEKLNVVILSYHTNVRGLRGLPIEK